MHYLYLIFSMKDTRIFILQTRKGKAALRSHMLLRNIKIDQRS